MPAMEESMDVHQLYVFMPACRCERHYDIFFQVRAPVQHTCLIVMK